ncbi:helix-turn-helix domain-containing protein [Streptomyces sp. NBC_00233]|uniref:helix-turn-helix domain-containing protein n=1 Tax=Streptomyces sp. NBC_00233 TaxID=2975686 RepID=UPI00338EAEA0
MSRAIRQRARDARSSGSTPLPARPTWLSATGLPGPADPEPDRTGPAASAAGPVSGVAAPDLRVGEEERPDHRRRASERVAGPLKVKQRFLEQVHGGMSIREACRIVRINRRTGQEWVSGRGPVTSCDRRPLHV